MRSVPVALLVALLGASLAGCAVTPEPTAEGTPEAPAAAPATTGSAWPEAVEIHRNASGQVVCPVMDVVIATPEDALESVEHEGRRYYFCCAMCPAKFKENPALYTPLGESL